MADNQRLQGVDALKGIAIIGAVFAHLVLLGGLNREGEGELPVIIQVIDLGLMPFFTFTDHLMPDMEMGAAALVALVVLILCYVICRLFLILATDKVRAIGMD